MFLVQVGQIVIQAATMRKPSNLALLWFLNALWGQYECISFIQEKRNRGKLRSHDTKWWKGTLGKYRRGLKTETSMTQRHENYIEAWSVLVWPRIHGILRWRKVFPNHRPTNRQSQNFSPSQTMVTPLLLSIPQDPDRKVSLSVCSITWVWKHWYRALSKK